jgi:hypothetical protein
MSHEWQPNWGLLACNQAQSSRGGHDASCYRNFGIDGIHLGYSHVRYKSGRAPTGNQENRRDRKSCLTQRCLRRDAGSYRIPVQPWRDENSFAKKLSGSENCGDRFKRRHVIILSDELLQPMWGKGRIKSPGGRQPAAFCLRYLPGDPLSKSSHRGRMHPRVGRSYPSVPPGH